MQHREFFEELGQLMKKHGIVTLHGGTVQHDPIKNRTVTKNVYIQKGYYEQSSTEAHKIIRILEQQNAFRLMEQALERSDKALFNQMIQFKKKKE